MPEQQRHIIQEAGSRRQDGRTAHARGRPGAAKGCTPVGPTGGSCRQRRHSNQPLPGPQPPTPRAPPALPHAGLRCGGSPRQAAPPSCALPAGGGTRPTGRRRGCASGRPAPPPLLPLPPPPPSSLLFLHLEGGEGSDRVAAWEVGSACWAGPPSGGGGGGGPWWTGPKPRRGAAALDRSPGGFSRCSARRTGRAQQESGWPIRSAAACKPQTRTADGAESLERRTGEPSVDECRRRQRGSGGADPSAANRQSC